MLHSIVVVCAHKFKFVVVAEAFRFPRICRGEGGGVGRWAGRSVVRCHSDPGPTGVPAAGRI